MNGIDFITELTHPMPLGLLTNASKDCLITRTRRRRRRRRRSFIASLL